jgi:hypothetical protein
VFGLPLILLIVFNLIPIAGVIQFGWNLNTLLLMYWAENAVIGLYTVARMINASRHGELGKSRSYQILFFLAHYSTFCVLHVVVLVSVFQIAGSNAQGAAWLFFVVLVLYAVQHGVSYRRIWVGQEEFKRLSSAETMVLPYVRVAPVFVLTIVGGIAVWYMGEPAAALAVLAALKVLVDAVAHVAVHRAIARREASLAQ